MTIELAPEKPFIEHAKEFEKAKQEHIAALVYERKALQAKTEARMAEIVAELKALGYSKPRAPRGSKKAEKTK
jgi:hypothetical protein